MLVDRAILQAKLVCVVFFRHEYQIFQKVSKLEYEIPEGFNATAADLVRNLLVSLHCLQVPLCVCGCVYLCVLERVCVHVLACLGARR